MTQSFDTSVINKEAVRQYVPVEPETTSLTSDGYTVILFWSSLKYDRNSSVQVKESTVTPNRHPRWKGLKPGAGHRDRQHLCIASFCLKQAGLPPCWLPPSFFYLFVALTCSSPRPIWLMCLKTPGTGYLSYSWPTSPSSGSNFTLNRPKQKTKKKVTISQNVRLPVLKWKLLNCLISC